MTNTTIFLRFPDEATFLALMPADFVRDGDGKGETGAPLPGGVPAISILGAGQVTGGTYDSEGNVITPPTPVPGYHVNALDTIPAGWQPYVIDPPPVTPWRTFNPQELPQ